MQSETLETLEPLDPSRSFTQLAVPLHPVTVNRKPKLFARSWGLQPGVTAAPSADFIYALAGEHATVKAALRHVFGDAFKNLENSAKGRSTSPKVLEQLRSVTSQLPGIEHGASMWLTVLSASLQSEPGESSIQSLALTIEGCLVRLARSMHVADKHVRQCPNCSAPPETWWRARQVELGEEESSFADRLLLGLLGRTHLSLLGVQGCSRPERLTELLNAGKGRPFANWLEVVRQRLAAPALKDIPARAACGVPDDKLYAANEGAMLTQHVVAAIVDGIDRRDSRLAAELRASAVDARQLAMAVDFVCAAQLGPEEMDEVVAFNHIAARVRLMSGGRLASAALA